MKSFSTILLISLLSIAMSGCAALDIKPWTLDNLVSDAVFSSITGDRIASGNPAKCNQIKMQCSTSNYSERTVNGELTCSCRN
ncbi:hypothetical protein E5672_13750 [Alteromonas portus]|uniref:Lipoprotein n=1 Tax=Alteromonas portus TaxID=2565549 RepID=A0A4U0ZGN9_9ALTE|nr:hypothetical protein [Alteromonas portus]TKB02170.1 hypothetical protein E5672_13750 [Alteromonas portus]